MAAATANPGPNNVRDVWRTPVDLDSDPAVAHAELEKTRQHFTVQEDILNTEQRRLDVVVREYNAAHGIVPCTIDPAMLEELCLTGREVGQDLTGDSRPAASCIIPQSAHSDPVRTLRADDRSLMTWTT